MHTGYVGGMGPPRGHRPPGHLVTTRDDVVFMRPPCASKTVLGIGLGIHACQAGHRVLFTAGEWFARVAPTWGASLARANEQKPGKRRAEFRRQRVDFRCR
jgi:hypothetical protein